MKNWKLLSVILASLLFVLAACGSDDSKTESETDTTTEEQTATEGTTEE